MLPELELIESYPPCIAAEMVILMRRMAFLREMVFGLTESQMSAWLDVCTRAEVIQRLSMIDAAG